MLKIAPTPLSFTSNFTKSKCAEIHYQESRFSIVCTFCGFITHFFDDFCEHFYGHVEHFVNTSTEASELNDVPNGGETSFHGKKDPLKLEATELVKSTKEETLCLLQEGSEKINVMKRTSVEEHTFESIIEDPLNDLKTAKEQVEYEIKLEDSSISKRTAARKYTVEHSSESFEKFSHNSDNDEFYRERSPSDKLNVSVDWTKSFAPNLLKNTCKRPYKARYAPNMCTYCGKTFRRRLQLDTHLNIHTGSKPHQCEICGRQFRAITTLARHRNTHKQLNVVFNCEYCAKSFSRRAAMLSHVLRHTQERRIPCDECEKHFYTINQMDTHKRKVHNKADDATLSFKCDLCTKRYRTASMLSTHKFKKHYKTAKLFCEQCGKKFVDEKQLEAHKAIHTCSIEKS